MSKSLFLTPLIPQSPPSNYRKDQYQNPLILNSPSEKHKLPPDRIVGRNYVLIKERFLFSSSLSNSSNLSSHTSHSNFDQLHNNQSQKHTFHCIYCNTSSDTIDNLSKLCQSRYLLAKTNPSSFSSEYHIKLINHCHSIRTYLSRFKSKYLHIKTCSNSMQTTLY